MNEHVDKIIDLRRYLVLTEGKMDQDAQRAIKISNAKEIHGD